VKVRRLVRPPAQFLVKFRVRIAVKNAESDLAHGSLIQLLLNLFQKLLGSALSAMFGECEDLGDDGGLGLLDLAVPPDDDISNVDCAAGYQAERVAWIVESPPSCSSVRRGTGKLKLNFEIISLAQGAGPELAEILDMLGSLLGIETTKRQVLGLSGFGVAKRCVLRIRRHCDFMGRGLSG
jgi:hypothetical protein